MNLQIRSVIAIFIALTCCQFAMAQGDDEILRVDSSIVRLNVGVVDKRGRPITTLDQKEFEIYEDGRKQKITRFEPTTAPFSVAILLDMSGSTSGFRQIISLSAARFLDALNSEDRIAVIEFYDKVNLLNDFTTNRESVLNSIRLANGLGKTQLYSALTLAADKLSKEKSTRKAIIVLTDGVDTKNQDDDRSILSKFTEDKMLSAVNPEENKRLNDFLRRADNNGISVYPLALPTGDPTRLTDPSPLQLNLYSIARKRMNLLAERTGGSVNYINRLEEMGKLYAEVAAELRTLYTIEYQSDNETNDKKYRKVEVKVASPSLIAKSKPGYFPK